MGIAERAGLLLLALALGGCGPTPLYTGAARPPQELARLSAAHPARLYAVDGQPVRGRHFALLPGPHTLHFDAARSMDSERLSTECRVSLEMARDRDYRVGADLLRERVDEPKAPDGVVTRYQLRVELQESGAPLEAETLECSQQHACMVGWRGHLHSRMVPCRLYDDARFAFGAATDVRFRHAAEGHALAGYAGHCEDFFASEQREQCYERASSEVLVVHLKDGSSLVFVPEEPLDASPERRDAAKAACKPSGALDDLSACLREQGFVPLRP